VLRTVVVRLVLLVVNIPLQFRMARRQAIRASAVSATNISPMKRLVPWRLIVAKIALLGRTGTGGLLARWTPTRTSSSQSCWLLPEHWPAPRFTDTCSYR
jgi:hypothetical protein